MGNEDVDKLIKKGLIVTVKPGEIKDLNPKVICIEEDEELIVKDNEPVPLHIGTKSEGVVAQFEVAPNKDIEYKELKWFIDGDKERPITGTLVTLVWTTNDNLNVKGRGIFIIPLGKSLTPDSRMYPVTVEGIIEIEEKVISYSTSFFVKFVE
jgi:hypothetical protein